MKLIRFSCFLVLFFSTNLFVNSMEQQFEMKKITIRNNANLQLKLNGNMLTIPIDNRPTFICSCSCGEEIFIDNEEADFEFPQCEDYKGVFTLENLAIQINNEQFEKKFKNKDIKGVNLIGPFDFLANSIKGHRITFFPPKNEEYAAPFNAVSLNLMDPCSVNFKINKFYLNYGVNNSYSIKFSGRNIKSAADLSINFKPDYELVLQNNQLSSTFIIYRRRQLNPLEQLFNLLDVQQPDNADNSENQSNDGGCPIF